MRRLNVLLRKFEERRAVEVLRVTENVAGAHREKRIAEVAAIHGRVIGDLQARYDRLAGVPIKIGADA